MNITEIILEEITLSGLTAIEICETRPRGDFEAAPCYWFAHRVVARMGGPSFMTFDTAPHDLGDHLRAAGQKHDIKGPRYCFIVHEGRVYDAANPYGVDQWDQLTYFRARGYKASNYIMECGRIIKEPNALVNPPIGSTPSRLIRFS